MSDRDMKAIVIGVSLVGIGLLLVALIIEWGLNK